MKTVDDIKNVLVVGAGTLGLRVALRCAMDGYITTMYDIDEAQLTTALEQHARLTKSMLNKGQIDEAAAARGRENLKISSNLDDAIKDVDLINESIIENIDIKKAFYKDLTPRLEKGVIVTTNTSYLLPSDLLGEIEEPELFCAFHFHNVFDQIVVDVMPHPGTDQRVIDLLMEFGRRIHQIPVFVQKESSGYMFNSILMAMIGQASNLFVKGIGSVQDIDRSFMGNFGTEVGPFGMLDQIGLDTAWHITSSLSDRKSQAFAVVLKEYIDAGKLGYKSGEGFYTYPNAEFNQPEFLKP